MKKPVTAITKRIKAKGKRKRSARELPYFTAAYTTSRYSNTTPGLAPKDTSITKRMVPSPKAMMGCLDRSRVTAAIGINVKVNAHDATATTATSSHRGVMPKDNNTAPTTTQPPAIM